MLECLLRGPVDGSLSELGASFLELLEKILVGEKAGAAADGNAGRKDFSESPAGLCPFAALRLS